MTRKRPSPAERNDAAIDAKLDEVEAEMRRIGYWEEDPPAVEPINSYLDMRFALWLQTVFLPHAREAVRTNTYAAGESMVGLAALRQYDYHESVPEAHALMGLLSDFDRLVNAVR